MKRKIIISILSVLLFALMLALWRTYIWIGQIPSFILPTPEEVGAQLLEMIRNGLLLKHSLITLLSILVGFLIGSLFGFLNGYIISRSRTIERILFPYVMLVQSTPKVSLIPLLVIWFGLGLTSKMLLIILSAFFPVLVNTIVGFRSVPEEYHHLMTILRASTRQNMFKMQLPLATPFLMAGFKVAMVQSVIGAIVSEWVAGEKGLGYLLVYGSTQYDSSLLISSILATSMLGVILFEIVDVLESRLLHWHASKTVFTEGN